METYPVDIDPGQVVRWTMAELQAAPSTFRISARRSTEAQDIAARKEWRLGDAEREDLSEIASVTTLEIAPEHASEGWLLSVIVEDEAGPRIGEDEEAAPEAEEPIELEAFYQDMIRPDRGTATVVAAVDNPTAQARLSELLDAIEHDRPHPDRRAPG